MPWYGWLLVGLLGAYLSCGVVIAILVHRSAHPRGAPWAILLWPLWLFPRSA